MNEIRQSFSDGSYEVVFNPSGRLYALRHGEPWRDLVGDNLVLSMLTEVERLREREQHRPKMWLVFYIYEKRKTLPDGRIECGSMMPVFTVEHEGTQDDLYAQLPDGLDGTPAREAWYPRVLEDAPRAPLWDLKAKADAFLERRKEAGLS